MNLGIALDVTIGLALTFLLVSLFATTVQELVAGWLGLRGRSLHKKISQLVSDPNEPGTIGKVKTFLEHPLIQALGSSTQSKPSYIPSKTIWGVVQDLATRGKAADTPRAIYDAIGLWAARENSLLGHAVQVLARDAAGDLDRLQRGIEQWYDHAMDRLSGDYKRSAGAMAIGYCFAAAVLLNVNAFAVISVLATNEEKRELAVAQAMGAVNVGEPGKVDQGKIAKALPIGWSSNQPASVDAGYVIYQALGWLLTALAASLGSAFWFDTLTRLVNLRNAGPRPATSATSEAMPAGASPTTTAQATETPRQLVPPPGPTNPALAPLPPWAPPPKPSAAKATAIATVS